MPDFKGYLSDLGGPSANMYGMHGRNLNVCEKCKRPSCINPQICPNLNTNHQRLLDIYHAVDAVKGIKKSFIGSGVRYDLLLYKSKDEAANRAAMEYTHELICHHVSGRLKVAPEHTSDRVLRLMRKPSFQQFYEFILYLLPPWMSGGGYGGVGCNHQAIGFPSRAGTRLHPHSNDCCNRNVVHRLRPLYPRTRVLCQKSTRQTCPTSIFFLVQARRTSRHRTESPTHRTSRPHQKALRLLPITTVRSPLIKNRSIL